LVIEVALIAFNYSLGFTQYFGIIFVILAFPSAYFGYLYLRLASYVDHPELKEYKSILPTHSSTNSEALTNLEVSKLIDSEAYKQYRRKIELAKGQMEGTGEFKEPEEELTE
jgi:cell division protein YceG involved in septum cleavage